MNRVRLAVLWLMLVPVAAGAAEKYRLAPFKDELFKYPKIISSEHDGAYLVVDFSEMRDVNGRDAIPEKKAQAKYVDLDVNDSAQDLVLGSGPNAVKYFAIGSTAKPAKAIASGWRASTGSGGCVYPLRCRIAARVVLHGRLPTAGEFRVAGFAGISPFGWVKLQPAKETTASEPIHP